MQAAGVEPASEKARREKNYVRFRFGDCQPPHYNRQENDSLARLSSACCSGPKLSAQSSKMTSRLHANIQALALRWSLPVRTSMQEAEQSCGVHDPGWLPPGSLQARTILVS